MNKYLVFLGIGFELLGLIGLAIYIGSLLGAQAQLATAGLILLALIIWLVHIVLLFRQKSE